MSKSLAEELAPLVNWVVDEFSPLLEKVAGGSSPLAEVVREVVLPLTRIAKEWSEAVLAFASAKEDRPAVRYAGLPLLFSELNRLSPWATGTAPPTPRVRTREVNPFSTILEVEA